MSLLGPDQLPKSGSKSGFFIATLLFSPLRLVFRPKMQFLPTVLLDKKNRDKTNLKI